MRVGSFSLLIPEGVERDSGHVLMAHGRTYTLRLRNHGSRRCDADVAIDGKSIGRYRISAGGTITLERSAHDTGRFTFFRADSAEGESAGAAKVDRPDRGLIRVTFCPERAPIRTVPTGSVLRGGPGGQSVPKSVGSEYEERTAGGLAPGVTGLTGHSNQAFVEVPDLDHDPTGEVTISLRLAADASVRELTPAPRGNPTPAPVD